MARSDLSVVVVSLVGGDVLAQCIERLPLTEVECVVVLKDKASDPALWARRYPRVRFLPGRDEPAAVSRRRGLEATAGAVVGLIDDTAWPDRGWCAAAIAAFRDREVVAAAGPVAIAGFLSDRCRALAWIEFGAFVPGSGARLPAGRLPANAIAFRRADLLAALARESGLDVEGVVARMRERGGRIAQQAEGMTATCSACTADGVLLASRFHQGRLYGAAHPLVGRGARLRALMRAITLPFSLITRHIRRITRADRQSLSLLLLLWLALMETAWAFGAAKGAISGAPDTPV